MVVVVVVGRSGREKWMGKLDGLGLLGGRGGTRRNGTRMAQ